LARIHLRQNGKVFEAFRFCSGFLNHLAVFQSLELHELREERRKGFDIRCSASVMQVEFLGIFKFGAYLHKQIRTLKSKKMKIFFLLTIETRKEKCEIVGA
jgi:hypothetical protein